MTNDDKLIPERKGSRQMIPARLRIPVKVKGRSDPEFLKTWGSKPVKKEKP